MHSGYHFGEGLDSYKPIEAYVRRRAGHCGEAAIIEVSEMTS